MEPISCENEVSAVCKAITAGLFSNATRLEGTVYESVDADYSGTNSYSLVRGTGGQGMGTSLSSKSIAHHQAVLDGTHFVECCVVCMVNLSGLDSWHWALQVRGLQAFIRMNGPLVLM